jgi:predicted permease
VPLWQARGFDPQQALKGEATGSASTGAGNRRVRTALVVSELALAVTLVVGAGLLIRSFWRLYGVDTGFRAQGVLRAQLNLPRGRYPVDSSRWPNLAEIHQFNAGVLAQAAALPGAVSVALAGNHPLDAGFTSSISVPGREDEAATWPEPSVRRVSPGYLETVRLPLRQGRDFTTSDDAAAPPVALLNQAAAARYFPAREPVGQQFALWGALRTVVGVVADERTRGLAEPPPPAVYLPLGQAPGTDGNEAILLRVRGDPAALGPALRAVIRRVDPALPVFDMESLEHTLGRSVGQQRFTMLLLGTFAATAIALALIGVHGVLSYLVARRSRELGLRLALGAAPQAVVRGVVLQGIPFIALGVGLGLAAAFAAGPLLRRFLFGVSSADPATYAIVGVAVFGAALLASWIPARRAARVDPMVALRHD